jgi:hypothetical protein
MENCTLHAILPSPTKWLKPAIGYVNNTEIVVWSLDTYHELDAPWARTPRRIGVLDRFRAGEEWHSLPFSCPSRTFQTFKFSCKGEQCHAGWCQNREGLNGVYMIQHDNLTIRVSFRGEDWVHYSDRMDSKERVPRL